LVKINYQSAAQRFIVLLSSALAMLFMVPAISVSASNANDISAKAIPTKAQSLETIADMTLDTENDLIEASDYYWHHGDYPRIIHLDRVIVEIDPSDTESYSNGGWLMESMGDKKNAEAFYKLGVVRNMNSSFMAYQLGFFYFNTLHDYKKAITVLKRSTKLADASSNDYKMLAHSYTHAKDFKDALATWKIVKQKFPTAIAVDHNLQEAQAAYDRSVSSQPEAH
jgi:tetratricopeptide (TPR) repeat protein